MLRVPQYFIVCPVPDQIWVSLSWRDLARSDIVAVFSEACGPDINGHHILKAMLVWSNQHVQRVSVQQIAANDLAPLGIR